uniref:HEAT repeat-containing protein 1 n=1 Tax=Oncorhynchus tshawytscha TaxID=74940 RepID=A0A8C8GRK1_ONCTS
MTSLAHQLKRLALPQNDPNLLTRREVVSLLFDPKDASRMDRSTFFALGCTGLEELMGIEPAFSEFQETLFSQASVGMERSVQSKEVNKKLDAGISLFLTRLSPYFLLKPAQKCIEWLVHRFHIHLYNVDTLLACALPYHETKVFVRVIQLFKLKDPTNRWNWLEGLQVIKPGVPLARGTLITHCYKDLGFMDFICTLVTKSIKGYSGHSGNCAQLRVIFSFYASTIVPALDAVEKVSDTIISKLLPYVQKGLKSSLTDYKAATYMIVCQLAVKVVMEAQLVDILALQISKSLCKEPVLPKEGLGCLIILLQNQKEEFYFLKLFHHFECLCAVTSLVPSLHAMAAVHDISPLLRYLLPHLVHAVTEEPSESTRHGNLFESVLQGLPLSGGLDNTVAKMLLEEYLSQSRLSAEGVTSLNQRLLPLVRLFESKYPGALYMVLEGHVGDISSAEDKNLFHQFISLSMSSGKYQILGDSDTSLVLSLKHPLPSVRHMAVEHLMGIVTSGQGGFDQAFLKEALLERMKDDVPEVVAATLKALEVTGWNMRLSMLKEAVRVLDEPRLLEGNSDLKTCVVWGLLPFLVVTSALPDSPDLQLATCVAQSTIISQHNLTQGWAHGKCIRKWCHNKCLLFFFKRKEADGLLASCLCCLSGETWWNPEKLDTNTCCYLRLLCRLFDVLITGAGQGHMAASFKALMKLLFQVHLSDPLELFKFLSLVWGYGSNLGDQLDCKVNAILQTQALYVGRAILSAQPGKTLTLLASGSSPVVLSLLACLSSPVREVRRAATATLQTLAQVDSSPFHPIIDRLLKTTEELTTGPTHLSQALGKLYEEAVTGTGKGKAWDKKLLVGLEELLLGVQVANCPAYTAKTILRALGEVNGEITKAFYSALGDEKVQQRLLGVMFDLLVESRSPACAQTISSVFKGIAVDGELVANELAPAEKPKVTVSVQQTRRSKMLQRKAQDTPQAVPKEGAVSWQRVTLILELLQHKKKLKRPQTLVPALFSLLSRCLETSTVERGNLEYTKQLILGCLLNVCQKLSPDGGPVSKDVLDEDKFNVEVVVQCVRMSDMPQTHHHALLLLGSVAGIFPEKVLHNIMPIFTFMGANIMRLDDTYSFQVINKTVRTVIPALIKSGDGESTAHMEAVVTRILHVFADALPHVPEHRRLPILSQLMSTLGPARFLWVLLLLMFKQHATQTNATDKDAALERDVEFWISVCCEFEVEEQLVSLIKILKYLMALPQDKEDGEKLNKPAMHLVSEKETAEELIFNMEAHSSKELRHFKFLSVSFMAQLLAAGSFVGMDSLQKLQQSLLEEILCYIHTVARCVEENTDKPTGKFWRALLNKAYDVLDKVNALLPTDTFITVMRGLMGNQLPSVRRKAMELLNNKLQQKTQWQEEQVTVLLDLKGDLLAIVGRGHGKVMEEEQAINRQTALYSLKLLCRSFGSDHKEAFVPVLNQAVEIVVSPEEEKNVMGSALLCIAEVASTLKALAIPQLPRLMPAVLQSLTERKEVLSNEIYMLSAVTALQRVTETLPHFISPYLQDTLLQVTSTIPYTNVHLKATAAPQLAMRLASLRTTVATKVPTRVLLPTLTKCYSKMVNSKQLGPLMSILKEHIGHMEKDQLTSHQSELTYFFLIALDFRAQHCQGDLEKAKEIEGYVIDCLLAMVMKLSEVSFRPLFFKLFDWCKTESVAKDRLLTFYRLSDSIADRLKGLFVLFAGHLVKPFSDLLRQTNVTKTDEAFFDTEDNIEKRCLLLEYILDCLHKICLYDTQRFVSKERADSLMTPLVDQLENTLGGEEVYQTRVTKHLVPCVGQFCVAVGDDTLWKTLNYQILLKTRHSSSKVRFSALLMLLELASKLRENYMVLLPETIPFLAELMEDECEEVEHQVQKVIHEMETILGEPLQSYF